MTKPTPKPVATRVAALRQRRAVAGIKRLELYAHADDHPRIRHYAATLTKDREKK